MDVFLSLEASRLAYSIMCCDALPTCVTLGIQVHCIIMERAQNNADSDCCSGGCSIAEQLLSVSCITQSVCCLVVLWMNFIMRSSADSLCAPSKFGAAGKRARDGRGRIKCCSAQQPVRNSCKESSLINPSVLVYSFSFFFIDALVDENTLHIYNYICMLGKRWKVYTAYLIRFVEMGWSCINNAPIRPLRGDKPALRTQHRIV
jgi:hypothetical protein